MGHVHPFSMAMLNNERVNGMGTLFSDKPESTRKIPETIISSKCWEEAGGLGASESFFGFPANLW